MSLDPVETNPDHYRVVFENERTRVLEYTDRPGDRTTPHEHPDSVTHVIFIELKEGRPDGASDAALGPQ